MTITIWPFGSSGVVPFWNQALNFSPNVFFWEQFKSALQSTIPFKKALEKRSLAAEPTKIAPFREATIHPHTLKLRPPLDRRSFLGRTMVLTYGTFFPSGHESARHFALANSARSEVCLVTATLFPGILGGKGDRRDPIKNFKRTLSAAGQDAALAS